VCFACFVLILRYLVRLYPAWLAGCVPRLDGSQLTIDNISEEDQLLIPRCLWYGGLWYLLAFSPFIVTVATKSVEAYELAAHFGIVALVYLLFHFWFLWLFLRKKHGFLSFFFRAQKPLLRLYSPVLGLEERIAELLNGKRVCQRGRERLFTRLFRVSQELVQLADELELEHDELEILRHVDGLFHKPVSLVMTPLSQIIQFSSDISLNEALEKSAIYGYSRYPVVDSQNRVCGIFRSKQLNLLNALDESVVHHLDQELRLASRQSCHEALVTLQENKRQLALVYSADKLVGLISLEDLLEQLVGEIEDEFDESDVKKLSTDVFLVNATVRLNQLTGVIAGGFGETRAETLNGWLQEYCGKIPASGAIINRGKMQIVILEVDQRRVVRVRIHLSSSGGNA